MKRIIFYSITLCTLLYSDNTEKDVFIEKYINKEDYKANQLQAEEYRKNISKDVNIKEISKKEHKEIDTTLEINKNNAEANKIAENINSDIKSIEFQKKVEANKELGIKYKDTILSQGGSYNMDKLFFNFAQREPSVDSLLKIDGIIS